MRAVIAIASHFIFQLRPPSQSLFCTNQSSSMKDKFIYGLEEAQRRVAIAKIQPQTKLNVSRVFESMESRIASTIGFEPLYRAGKATDSYLGRPDLSVVAQTGLVTIVQTMICIPINRPVCRRCEYDKPYEHAGVGSRYPRNMQHEGTCNATN